MKTEPNQATDYKQRIVDGHRLRAYRLHEAGPAAPLLAMVHGLEGSWDNWRPLCRGCFENFNLFSLELPWDGRDGYYWCFTRPAHEWLRLTLQLLPQKPAILLAHSYGVNVLLEYLQRRPMPDLAGLVLISAFYRRDLSENDWKLFERSLQGFRTIIGEGLQLRRGKAMEPELVAKLAEKVFDHVGPVGFSECFSHFVRTPALKLERIAVPALVLAGESDSAATALDNAALAAALPFSDLTVLSHCGHFCMIERPEMVEQTVRRFLLKQRPEWTERTLAGLGSRSVPVPKQN